MTDFQEGQSNCIILSEHTKYTDYTVLNGGNTAHCLAEGNASDILLKYLRNKVTA